MSTTPVYSLTPGQIDTLVELARGGQTCAAVVPANSDIGTVLDELASRISTADDSEEKVRRTNGKQAVIFGGGGSILVCTADKVQGLTLHAAALAAPYEIVLPAVAIGGGQVLAP